MMNIMEFLQGLLGGGSDDQEPNYGIGDFLNMLFPSGTSARELDVRGENLTARAGSDYNRVKGIERPGGLRPFDAPSDVPPEPSFDRSSIGKFRPFDAPLSFPDRFAPNRGFGGQSRPVVLNRPVGFVRNPLTGLRGR
jgi:hypothetical protein